MNRQFTESDMKSFEPEAKLGLLATVTPDGLPHITLITTFRAKSAVELMWGQFIEGKSKKNVQTNPKTAFAILNNDRQLWRGTAVWTHTAREGDDYTVFNNMPMFRYNSYFGIHTVHYMDLVGTTGMTMLKLPQVITSSLLTMAARQFAGTGVKDEILKPFAVGLFNGMTTVKFISWIGADGFPRLVPAMQCQAADSRRLVFVPFAYGDELAEIPDGATVAVFGVSFSMEDCLVRGRFSRRAGLPFCHVDINWVYNSMPPNPGQIYPEVKLEPVTVF
ncbi:MAG: pyridoxamine 5'-phosphate oxidase family protein [Myxococcota bacterium]